MQETRARLQWQTQIKNSKEKSLASSDEDDDVDDDGDTERLCALCSVNECECWGSISLSTVPSSAIHLLLSCMAKVCIK